MSWLIRFIATLGPIGYVPWCPGTLASLVTVCLMFMLPPLPWMFHVLLIGAVLPFSIWSTGMVECECGHKDPSCAVLDEFVGMNVALVGLCHSWQAYVAAFIAFRFFDILKPFPINVIERRLEGGVGIIMDDVAAGIAARLALSAISFLWPLW